MASLGADAIEGGTILIADDNPENLDLLSRMLSSARYRVRVARDGRLALLSAQAEKPDLILLDAHMPAMDGYETCRRLKEDPALRDTPVLFISALSESFNRRMAYEAGAVDYLDKPFRLEDLLKRVSNALLLNFYEKRCASLESEIAALKADREEIRDEP